MYTHNSGPTPRPADIGTPPSARTSGCVASARSPVSSAANAPTKLSSQSRNRQSSTICTASVSWESTPFLSTTRAGSSRLTSTRAAGPTMREPSPRRAEISACRWRSNALGPGKARTRGSSFPDKSPRARRGRWPATSSPRRCRGAISSAWAHTIASPPIVDGHPHGPSNSHITNALRAQMAFTEAELERYVARQDRI